jgi:cyclopropane fatty-acyl-phospholipid synthase-like methyltransferase
MAYLPEPTVPPGAYDEAYYREWCAGYEQWTRSEGEQIAGIYPGFLIRARARPGEVIVDIGTGRGELLVAATQMGAARAYGIEYSPAAVEMTRRTLGVHGAGDRAEVVLADARSVPLPDAIADLVCYVDVVEHLTPSELHVALREAHRILKPGGRVVAHTMPNRLIYTATYRALRLLFSANRWPADPRNAHEQLMHVNEQTTRGLRRALTEAGFRAEATLGEWIYTDFVPSRNAKRVYKLLAHLGPLAQFGRGDLWGVGYR